MATLIDYTIHQAVERDGLPRVAAYDDGSQSVLYLAGADIVQSLPTADWLATRGPLPADPTAQQIADAIAARQAAAAQAEQDAATLRARVRQVAGSAVGVAFDQLTAAQLRALFGIVLYQAGALDKNGVVRPLSEWFR